MKSGASIYVKDRGLRSIKEMSEISGVLEGTLNSWFVNKNQLFDVVVSGCLAKIREKKYDMDTINKFNKLIREFEKGHY